MENVYKASVSQTLPKGKSFGTVTNRVSCSDARVGALIKNGMIEKKRSFFVVVGDQHAKDVIANLYYLMSQAQIKHNKTVLWAYKKKLLDFTR